MPMWALLPTRKPRRRWSKKVRDVRAQAAQSPPPEAFMFQSCSRCSRSKSVRPPGPVDPNHQNSHTKPVEHVLQEGHVRISVD